MEILGLKIEIKWLVLGGLGTVLFLYVLIATPLGKGHAVEISVKNSSKVDIFAYIDSGRHGDVPVVSIDTTENKKSPDGLRIPADTQQSFAHAVGLFDSPLLHVMPIVDDRADSSKRYDCPFDTVSFQNIIYKRELPSFHVTLEWTGANCKVLAPTEK